MSAPTQIQLKKKSNLLCLTFKGMTYDLPAEYLRVYSPSAEVTQHGGPKQWPTGKQQVRLENVRPIGHYALQLTFDDGHHSGLYTWDYLLILGQQQQEHWQIYLEALNKMGASRDPLESKIKFL
jgi:DUF971 family protein